MENQRIADRNLRVLMDMDGVLADFEGHFLNSYRAKYPDLPYVTLDNRTSFYLYEQYNKLGENMREKVESILYSENFFGTIPPIPGAIEAIREMEQMENVDVMICSQPMSFYKHCLKEKMDWVVHHLGESWIPRVILCRDKTMIKGDLLIDDRHNITGHADPEWEHVLFAAPHNRQAEIGDQVRLDSWVDRHVWLEAIARCQRRLVGQQTQILE